MKTTTNADKTQIITIGDSVTIRESDAPEFNARVIGIQKDENFGDNVQILRVNCSPCWVSINRIVGKVHEISFNVDSAVDSINDRVTTTADYTDAQLVELLDYAGDRDLNWLTKKIAYMMHARGILSDRDSSIIFTPTFE
jgi:hypothetical protein